MKYALAKFHEMPIVKYYCVNLATYEVIVCNLVIGDREYSYLETLK